MLVPILNRLLTHDEPSRGKLAQFAGARVKFDTPPLAQTVQINERGYLIEADDSSPVALTIRLPLSATPLALLGKERLLREAQIEGNIALGNALSALLDMAPLALQQEVENWVGPVAANALAQTGQRVASALQAVHESLSRNATKALTQGAHPMLPTADAVKAWAYEVNGLAQRVQALEQRIARLS